MEYSLSIQIEAIIELNEAFDWYEEKKAGLGYELLEEVEVCYGSLKLNPERYSFINHLYRRIKTNRFPYLLIYEIENDDIIIVAVRHTKRKPL